VAQPADDLEAAEKRNGHRIPRTAEEETDVILRLRSLLIASESWLIIL
jgi:hypothetical protein